MMDGVAEGDGADLRTDGRLTLALIPGTRTDAPATLEQKAALRDLSPQAIQATDLAGEEAEEQVRLLVRWTTDGRGRADAEVSGGDLAPVVVSLSECWDADKARVFYEDSHGLSEAEGALPRAAGAEREARRAAGEAREARADVTRERCEARATRCPSSSPRTSSGPADSRKGWPASPSTKVNPSERCSGGPAAT